MCINVKTEPGTRGVNQNSRFVSTQLVKHCRRAERNLKEAMLKGNVSSVEVDKPDTGYTESTGKLCPGFWP